MRDAKELYTEPVDLTIENVTQLLNAHRMRITIGYTINPGELANGLRWWAFLSELKTLNGETLGTSESPTGRGSSPNNAVLDLFETLSGATCDFEYEHHRAKLTLVFPPFRVTRASAAVVAPITSRATRKPRSSRRRA